VRVIDDPATTKLREAMLAAVERRDRMLEEIRAEEEI
jgi:hypothetical protein